MTELEIRLAGRSCTERPDHETELKSWDQHLKPMTNKHLEVSKNNNIINGMHYARESAVLFGELYTAVPSIM